VDRRTRVARSVGYDRPTVSAEKKTTATELLVFRAQSPDSDIFVAVFFRFCHCAPAKNAYIFE
jgi:hypothetical protein